MRLVKLYQVFDEKASTTMGPIFAVNNEVPVARELQGHVNDTSTIIGQHPDDFVCVLLGYQDLDTGKLDALENPEIVFRCAALLTKREATPHGEQSTKPA